MLQTFLDDLPEVAVGEFEDCSATHVESELFQFGEASSRKFVRQSARGKSEITTQPGGEAFEKARRLSTARWLEFGADLEASPCCPVEKLAVVCRPD